jgi:TRAP-type C4-dicarboxylate transport system permease small subunit
MSGWPAFERKMCRFFLLISGITLASMLVFTVLNVVMRAFRKPIVGDYEVISFLGAVVVGFALPYTSWVKGHVAVDFLLEKLSKHAGGRIQVATRIASTALFLWIGWNFVVLSLDLIKTKEVTQLLKVPYYPISFALALCCLFQCVTFLSQIKAIVGGMHE